MLTNEPNVKKSGLNIRFLVLTLGFARLALGLLTLGFLTLGFLTLGFLTLGSLDLMLTRQGPRFESCGRAFSCAAVRS